MQDRENAGVLLEYVERKLTPDVAAAFERHLDACPACREAVGAQQTVWAALDAWNAAEISPDFNRRLYERIESEEGRAWWRRLFQPVLPWSLRPAMPLAAACMVLVAVLVFQGPGEVERQTKSVQTIDIEQVERTLDDLEMLKQLGVSTAESQESRTL
jgi:anti-sigma factor RsiW